MRKGIIHLQINSAVLHFSLDGCSFQPSFVALIIGIRGKERMTVYFALMTLLYIASVVILFVGGYQIIKHEEK
ncbi:hypothetical protein [Bacillus smithii]|uniref:hypothetical protein n=1 Tax=Bacillus smithii TaxID=1479 RepID=UPI002E1CD74D|nr:hypothetical protein [Bacillus smithii]